MGPQPETLKERSAPMVAYKSGAEAVLLGREIGGDEGKDIRREAAYGNQRVYPFTDGRQCSRSTSVEFGNVIKGETI